MKADSDSLGLSAAFELIEDAVPLKAKRGWGLSIARHEGILFSKEFSSRHIFAS